MSLSNNKITAPVSIDDVKSILGESSNDVATLCKSSKINVWAKYKPTDYNAAFSDNWSKGKDGNYGLNITTDNRVSSWSALVAEYSKANNGYSNIYKRPSGGASSPYRLGDFRGYNHKAKPEISDYLAATNYLEDSQISLSVAYNAVTVDGDQVSYNDVEVYKGLYFGYVITDISGKTLKLIVTASTTSSYEVRIAARTLLAGNYRLYPMFCNVDYSTNHTLRAMYCYAIPNLAGGKIMLIITQSQSVTSNFKSIFAEYTFANTRIKVTLTTTEHGQATNIGVYFCYQTDPTKGQAMVSGEYSTRIDRIGFGETKSVTFKNPLSGKSYLIYVYCDGAWIAKGLPPKTSFMPDL